MFSEKMPNCKLFFYWETFLKKPNFRNLAWNMLAFWQHRLRSVIPKSKCYFSTITT